MKNLLHAIALLAMALLLILLPGCRNSRPTLIVQISDPQLGFSTESHDLSPDTAMFGEAIRRINQLQPDAVVITGDLVHECDDPVQLAMVRALLDRIDPEIAIFPLPGNHDIRIEGQNVNAARYMAEHGKDRFVHTLKNCLLVGLNSSYIKQHAPQEQEQKQWLVERLQEYAEVPHKIIFVHHPFFREKIDEPNDYFSIDSADRRRYFDLFAQYGVEAVYAGHLHDNAQGEYLGIRMVTTSAVCRQLGKARPGVRLIEINREGLKDRYVSTQEIPTER